MVRSKLLIMVGLTVLAVWAVTACSAGSGIVAEQRAQAFVGGALSDFGGVEGDNATARATSRDIAIARDFDFIHAGAVIDSGTAATTTGSADPSFGDGAGPITVVGDDATVELSIASLAAGIDNVVLTGEFSMSAAQAAVEDAGMSFTIDWTFSFTITGVPTELTASQVLSGAYWVPI